MENSGMSVQSTKKITKINYSFDGEQVSRRATTDVVIVEQPLQVTLSWSQDGQRQESIFAITMRTPKNEQVLIIGLLSSEGVINSLKDIESVAMDADEKDNNQWLVQLAPNVVPVLASLERYQITYSSCGLCGATSLNALELKNPIQLTQAEQGFYFPINRITRLSVQMAEQQKLFSQTGGVHSAALFDNQANLLHSFEDIGRHNAVDKVIGHHLLKQHKLLEKNKPLKQPLKKQALLSPEMPLERVSELLVLLVSSRISFEIVQKAVMAGFSILVGVGAPSDLAIQAAQRFDLTLIGFVSERGFNVYHGDWRLTD